MHLQGSPAATWHGGTGGRGAPHTVFGGHSPPPPSDGQGLRSDACKMGRQPHASVLMLGNVVVCARVLLLPSPPRYVQGWCGDHRQVQLCAHRANSLVGGWTQSG